jgi:hypothetical protein
VRSRTRVVFWRRGRVVCEREGDVRIRVSGCFLFWPGLSSYIAIVYPN